MRYKCLILDHDDTSVESTAVIHYPAHVETMKLLRPGEAPVSLDDWLRKNFEPGVMEFFTDELMFSKEEIEQEYVVWRRYNENAVPGFFPGIPDLIRKFQRAGGIVAVVSHSEADNIERHYNLKGEGVTPDIIFGWDYDPEKRKPSSWPVEQIIAEYRLSPSDMLMVDDLKPGLEMARRSGIEIAGAGWGHRIPEIEEYMRKECDYYFKTVGELSSFIFVG